MASKSMQNCERNFAAKLLLPNHFKKIGIAVAITSFLLLVANNLLMDSLTVRYGGKYGILVGMLLIAISREKIEDELVVNLRMQAFSLSFVLGVIFSILQPYFNYGVDYFLAPTATFKDTGDFQILWLLLSVKVFYFEYLKRMYDEK